MSSAELGAGHRLEIHIHLKTRTKMFCRCSVGYGDEPNTHTCPVCLGHPGVLPIPTARAVEWTIKLGHALGCRIAEHAIFHRKNYFYPDLPKGYQICQYDEPALLGGTLDVPGRGRRPRGRDRPRAPRGGRGEERPRRRRERPDPGATATLVDFNRGGTPLVEIVTAPTSTRPTTRAVSCSCSGRPSSSSASPTRRWRKGSLRFDVNVSVRPAGSDELRTRTELKNMNSFAFAARGIEREDRPARSRLRGGRHGRAGDAPLRPGARVGAAAPARRRRRRTTATCPSPTSCRCGPPGAGRADATELREPPGARIRRLEADYGFELRRGLVVNGAVGSTHASGATSGEWTRTSS